MAVSILGTHTRFLLFFRMKKVAVILQNMGGPISEDAVAPFLYNLFMDEDIIKIPLKGGARRAFVGWFSKKRAAKVATKYAEISPCVNGCTGRMDCPNRLAQRGSTCCSPINPETERQRSALQTALNAAGGSTQYEVLTCFRYTKPDTADTLDYLEKHAFDELVILPLYPHFSYTTSASGFNEWRRHLQQRTIEGKWKTHYINSYHLDEHYIAALNARIDEALATIPAETRDEVQLIFSAHGTPIAEREAGDPYSVQLRETVRAVMSARGNDLPYWETFQSKVGPAKWLEPNTEEFIKVLRGYGIRHLLVVPIAFVQDHIETLHEIGIEFREVAEHVGIETFAVCKALNDHPRFIQAMAAMVRKRAEK